jgi:hypothetical protein
MESTMAAILPVTIWATPVTSRHRRLRNTDAILPGAGAMYLLHLWHGGDRPQARCPPNRLSALSKTIDLAGDRLGDDCDIASLKAAQYGRHLVPRQHPILGFVDGVEELGPKPNVFPTDFFCSALSTALRRSA